jgi:hypothetical protein
MPANSDYAKLLFDEWKYRHETLWRTMYRHIWYLVILGLLPIIAEATKLNEIAPGVVRFFCEVRHGGAVGEIYWGLVIALYVGATVHLIFEHVYFKCVENRLAGFPVAYKAPTLSRKQGVVLCVLVVLWLAAWGGFAYLIGHYLNHTPKTSCDAAPTAESLKTPCVPCPAPASSQDK